MSLYFLRAEGVKIQKQYTLCGNNEVKKHNYPFIYEVSSYEEANSDLRQMYEFLTKHASQGHCLLKGILHKPLVKESRAGSTDRMDKTNWICLDLDGVQNYQSVDHFLNDIGCGDTDYILQWSSSMGIENQAGFRCHVFMQLNSHVSPDLLKLWLMTLNLTTPNLAHQLELTKTNNSLRWPLDITTCQNDKLIYIAPPLLDPGIPDPFPDETNPRIVLVTKNNRTLKAPNVSQSREAVRKLVHEKVNELRDKAHLPKRKNTKFKFQGTVEYMESPDVALITGIKEERGFVYFNLNGGDSWAYYHPIDNPAFIYNFKGEPAYKTEDLLPEYWAELVQKTSSCTPNGQGIIYLAFRDFRTSDYYNGSYDTTTQQLDLARAKNETQLRHFMKQHGQPLGDFVPDWTLSFDPHSPVVVDPVQKTVNIYQPSEYMANPPAPNNTCRYIPTVTHKVIQHVLGYDQPTVDHFINWLACIVQYQTRTGTAWVLQGTQGTGKGILFHQILSPILGDHNCVAKRMEEIESEFTGFMENKFLVFIDEIESGRSLYHTKVTAKLKNLIVEPTISIRKMYTAPYMAPNFSNMIFASNKPAPVEISPDDRRFNVGPYQTNRLNITNQEVDILAAERQVFCDYLRHYKADSDKARLPLQSSARDTLIDISRASVDVVSDALATGNMEFFWDQLPARKPQDTGLDLGSLAYERYRAWVIDLIQQGTKEQSREDLFTVFEFCIGGMPKSPNKFTSLLKHHNVLIKPLWKGNRTVRGISVNWQADPQWLAQCQADIAAGLI